MIPNNFLIKLNCFLGRHYPVKSGNIIKCKYCNKQLSSFKLLKKHVLLMHELEKFKGKNILDVGCGSFPLGTVNVDIDSSNKKADKIIDTNGILPFNDNSFDAIILSDVLQQSPVPEKLLSESRRVLKSNGSVFVTIPNSGNPLFRLGLWKQHTVIGVKHRNFWTKKEFEELALNTGLKIKKFIPTYYTIGNDSLFKIFPFFSFCLFFRLIKD